MTFVMLLAPLAAEAQQVQGYVKTIGRPGKPGAPVPNTTIRWKGTVNSTVSGKDGRFTSTMPGKKDGDAIVLQSVNKQGYELQDKGIIGRPLVFSTTVPIVITMVSTAQLQADKHRIEQNAYQISERNYKKKISQLNKEVEEKKITAEEYHQQLVDLQNKYEAYQSLIGDMADRYARTDYDQLDSVDYQINLCIENGELERADSLIHTVFNPETVLERNRAAKDEIRQRIEFAQSVIDKATRDKEAIMRDLDYARRVVALAQNLIDEYLAQGATDQALECLKKNLEIISLLDGEDSEQAIATKEQILTLENQ
jgi:tetratricopeptide (TPR) repeat protein